MRAMVRPAPWSFLRTAGDFSGIDRKNLKVS